MKNTARPAGEQPPVVIEYPVQYSFKIIGLAGDDFPEHARRLVARVAGDAATPAAGMTTRASAGGKYHAVSVSVTLRSEEERKAIYLLLWEDERVVYYL